MARRIESLLLAGPAGRLEALLEEPEDAAPGFAALVCHPHPLYGGTMLNKVVHRLGRGLRAAGGRVEDCRDWTATTRVSRARWPTQRVHRTVTS